MENPKMVHDTNDKVDTLKYMEKKLVDSGVHRLERHTAHVNNTSVKKPPPKKGHGGKYTWEGPGPEPEAELEAVPTLDEGDPNYVDEDEEKKVVNNEDGDEEVKERVKGEVEVPKVVEVMEDKGVARIEVDPHLNNV